MKHGLALVFALALFAFACADNDPPGGLRPPPATPDVRGPLLVYTRMLQEEGSARIELVVYDAYERRVLRRANLPHARFALAPRELFFVRQDGSQPPQIAAIDVFSGVVRTLYTSPALLASQVAVTADGATLAFTELPPDQASSEVRLLDITSGAVRTLRSFGSPLAAEFRGVPEPRAWRAGGGLLVSGNTGSGVPGTWATIGLDGALNAHGQDFYVPSPDGDRLASPGYSGTGCAPVAPQRLGIYDIAAAAVVAAVEDPARGLVYEEWAPDGSALLYRQYLPVAGTQDDACLPSFEVASGRAFLLPATGGAPQPVDDVAALRRAWHGERSAELVCAVGAVADVFGRCGGAPQTLLVNGAAVETASGIEIVGFVEP